jgi:hypothetical protein
VRLPDGVDRNWFRRTFVTTYMTYVGELMNPWDVPAKQAMEKMQVIWAETGGTEYKITDSTPIYRKVRGRYVLEQQTNIRI